MHENESFYSTRPRVDIEVNSAGSRIMTSQTIKIHDNSELMSPGWFKKSRNWWYSHAAKMAILLAVASR